MPSYPPRTNTTKKQDQLAQREQELEHAIRSAFSRERLTRAVEAVRAAQLSLFKAELHWAEEAKITGRDVNARVNEIQAKAQRWKERTVDEILQDYLS